MINIRSHITKALQERQPVVALESTLIAHGLPWPLNLETALAAEEVIRTKGCVPATIAVLNGQPTIGLNTDEITELARARNVLKASRRDLAVAVAQRRNAATTVSATMFLTHCAGIRVFATGGIGGVHRQVQPPDVSADLEELARTPVAVVCAGAKNILDIPATLERLETLGVPVLGFGVDTFPAFYLRSSGAAVSGRANTAHEAAAVLQAHWRLQGAGVVVANPIAEEAAIAEEDFQAALARAEKDAADAGIHGKDVTPFLLRRIAELTEGRTLPANYALIRANAQLAAEIALELARLA